MVRLVLPILVVVMVCLHISRVSAHGAGDIDGKYLFNNHCAGCHGADGAGTGMLKPLKGSEFLKSATDKDIKDIIVDGTTGGMIPMPPMKNKLKKEETEAIVEYIKSLK